MDNANASASSAKVVKVNEYVERLRAKTLAATVGLVNIPKAAVKPTK